MKIKIVLVELCLLTLALALSAQDLSKVEQAYSESEFNEMKKNNTGDLGYLAFKADNIYLVQNLAGKKDISDLPDISEINARAIDHSTPQLNADNFNPDTFNPLLYELDLDNKFAYYRIGDTGVVLQFLSEQRCRELYDKK